MIGLALFALASCSGIGERVEVVVDQAQAKKYAALKAAVKVLCKTADVDTVLRAVDDNPAMLRGMIIVCPATIGRMAAMLQAAGTGPLDITITIVEPGATAPADVEVDALPP